MKINKMTYCQRCVYPQISINLDIDNEGVCSSCRTFEKFSLIPEAEWERRAVLFAKTVKEIIKNSTANYDCVIPVSGGKDSYYQTHIMAVELGLKPLLVTYHGNNYTAEGDYNRDRMRQVFDADHLVMGPSAKALKKLNRLCFRIMGDMNWHNHCGIMSFPVQVAAKFNIPLVIWGEVAWDISGMYEPEDFVEFSARVRHEHNNRGFEWTDLIHDLKDPLTEQDMLWSKYPTDEEILKNGIRGLYIGNYYKWDPYRHTKMVQKKYGWKQSQKPFDRTYRMISNLDDRYENGVHDLLKFIKFGYGRASDHASKDIRTGYMSRDTGIEMVKKHDSVVSSDLSLWLEYVDMKEDDFWKIADTFRDPRVWTIFKGQWWKDNIWGEPTAYGSVYLTKKDQAKFH